MTSILQISDTHLAADGVLVSGRLKTDASFEKLLARLVDAQEQWGNIDAVIVTGDISDDGSEQSYSRFKALVAPLVTTINENRCVARSVMTAISQAQACSTGTEK